MRVFIVDDSRLARLELKQQLTQIGNITLVGEAENLTQAKSLITQEKLDLLLLDIDLPDGTGFDLLEQLSSVPKVIFVTAFNEYAIKSFEYNALDYLLKPVRQERLEQALQKVSTTLNDNSLSTDQRIFIKDRDQCYFVAVHDIIALEAMGNYTRVHLKDGVPSIYKPISAVSERLSKKVFFKASRSWLINTNFISDIEPQLNGSLEVTLIQGKRVVISKRQTAEFKNTWSL